MRVTPYGWPDEALEIVRDAWAKGHSASQIARMLPPDGHGVRPSKNAVIGKVHRLGLSSRATTSRIDRISADRRHLGARSGGLVNKIKGKLGHLKRNGCWGEYDPTPPVFVAPHVEDKARVSILDLDHETCRWPVGEVGKPGFGYCGLRLADNAHGQPYCPGHHARARVKPIRPARAETVTPQRAPALAVNS